MRILAVAALALASGAARAQQPPPVPLTAGFGCTAYATGLGTTASASPEISAYSPGCDPTLAPFLGSVTQEDPWSNHNKSCNWLGPAWNYMADAVLPPAPDDWVQLGIANGIADMAIDAQTSPTTINPVTCWQRAYGHTFVGWNDLTDPNSADAIYKHNLIVEFDARIVAQTQNAAAWPSTFSGSRATLGMAINNGGYLELDWEQPGYAASLNEAPDGSPQCSGAPYEACQYGPGFEVKFLPATAYGAPQLVPGADWVHVKLPVTAIAKSLTWYRHPKGGVAFYIGVEGIGAEHVELQVQNWNPYWAVR